ncbi:MAG: Thioester reductase protein [Pseudomonadota bacterium]|nr:Thioester reductase protein [Pseudomonadota bacterium]
MNPIESELYSDSFLDENIKYNFSNYHLKEDPSAIFLTGSTGFLGIHLLAELLTCSKASIYCLVRGADADAGRRRIVEKMQQSRLWKDNYYQRIIPVIGDLEQDMLGLSEEQFRGLAEQVDVIYHNGAFVNSLYPYSRLRASNVAGTREILRLSGLYNTKPVHYISTLSVFSGNNFQTNQTVFLEEDFPRCPTKNSGYVQTKWVSEQMVQNAQNRGLPASIYRIGRIFGNSQSRLMANYSSDSFCIFLKACVLAKKFPSNRDKIYLTPVDFVSRSVAFISRHPDLYGKVFHIYNSRPTLWLNIFDVIQSLGYPMESILRYDWNKEVISIASTLEQTNPVECMQLSLAAASLTGAPDAKIRIDDRHASAALSRGGISCPLVDNDFLRRHIYYLQENQFLPAPSRCPSSSNVVAYWRWIASHGR